jgi:hypothetical protein
MSSTPNKEPEPDPRFLAEVMADLKRSAAYVMEVQISTGRERAEIRPGAMRCVMDDDDDHR